MYRYFQLMEKLQENLVERKQLNRLLGKFNPFKSWCPNQLICRKRQIFFFFGGGGGGRRCSFPRNLSGFLASEGSFLAFSDTIFDTFHLQRLNTRLYKSIVWLRESALVLAYILEKGYLHTI